MRNIIKLFILVIGITWTISPILCQDTTVVNSVDTSSISADTTSGFLKTDNVEVIKAFEVKLADATMLTISPSPPVLTPLVKDYDYDVTIVPYNIEYPAPVIRPIAMRKDDPPIIYNNWLKLGYGNLKNGFGALQINRRFSDLKNWNLGLQFESLDNSEEIPFQKYQVIKGRTSLGFPVFETSAVHLDLGGGLENRRFFYNAPDPPDFATEDETKRNIATLSAGIRFFNAVDNSTLVDYSIALRTNYTHLSDLEEGEFNGVLDIDLVKRRDDGISFTFSGGVDFNSALDTNDLIGYIDPHLRISKEKFTGQIGFDYIYANEQSYVFPSVDLQYAISKKSLQVFAGVDQSYFRNNLRNSVNYNSFSTGFKGVPTLVTRDFYAGAKGDILGLKYNAQVGYKDYENHGIYLTDFQDSLRRLNIAVTDLVSYYFSGTVTIPVRDFLNVGGSVTKHIFEDVESNFMWHIPSLDVSLFGELSLLNDKFHIRSDFFIRDGVDAPTLTGNETLDDLFDLNLEATIRPSEAFGIYVSGKNLLDRSYRRWYGYPNVGIHLEGGIKLKF